jgi:hypothetical protein
MKTLQTPSSSANKILFPNVSVLHELIDIASTGPGDVGRRNRSIGFHA